MKTYTIMRAPGPQALRRRSPQMKNVARMIGLGSREVLERYARDVYVASGHSQYRSHRLVWVGQNTYTRVLWNDDDGKQGRARRWRLVVTLANGAYVHDVSFEAWEQS